MRRSPGFYHALPLGGGVSVPGSVEITTPDLRFDPHRPITVNGYPFSPLGQRCAEEMQAENDDAELAELLEQWRAAKGTFTHGLIVGLLLTPLLWCALAWAVQGWGGGFYG